VGVRTPGGGSKVQSSGEGRGWAELYYMKFECNKEHILGHIPSKGHVQQLSVASSGIISR
jgi:hypothetical protein